MELCAARRSAVTGSGFLPEKALLCWSLLLQNAVCVPQYEHVPPGARSDRVCASLSACRAGEQFEARPPNATGGTENKSLVSHTALNSNKSTFSTFNMKKKTCFLFPWAVCFLNGPPAFVILGMPRATARARRCPSATLAASSRRPVQPPTAHHPPCAAGGGDNDGSANH